MPCVTDGGVSVGVKARKDPIICDTQLLVRSYHHTEQKKECCDCVPQEYSKRVCLWKILYLLRKSDMTSTSIHIHSHTYRSFRNIQISSLSKFNMTAPLDKTWLRNCKMFWYVGIYFKMLLTVWGFGSM